MVDHQSLSLFVISVVLRQDPDSPIVLALKCARIVDIERLLLCGPDDLSDMDYTDSDTGSFVKLRNADRNLIMMMFITMVNYNRTQGVDFGIDWTAMTFDQFLRFCLHPHWAAFLSPSGVLLPSAPIPTSPAVAPRNDALASFKKGRNLSIETVRHFQPLRMRKIGMLSIVAPLLRLVLKMFMKFWMLHMYLPIPMLLLFLMQSNDSCMLLLRKLCSLINSKPLFDATRQVTMRSPFTVKLLPFFRILFKLLRVLDSSSATSPMFAGVMGLGVVLHMLLFLIGKSRFVCTIPFPTILLVLSNVPCLKTLFNPCLNSAMSKLLLICT